MKLLDAAEVRSEKKRSVAEQGERVRRLQEEESLSSSRLNAALSRERSELERIESGLALAREEYERTSGELRQEVSALEARKVEALKPTRDREIAVAKAESSLAEKEEEFFKKAGALEIRLAEAIGARGNYERRLAELDEYRRAVDESGRKAFSDAEDHERLVMARESRFNDERVRLRAYFEAEDAKVSAKIMELRVLQKEHA